MNSVKEVLKEAEGVEMPMLAEGQLQYILERLESVLHLDGDVVELGCNIGMTSSFIQRLLKHTDGRKSFCVYDSFEGLPPKTNEDGATPCDKGASAVSIEAFKKTFKDAKIDLPHINKGFFGDISDDKYPDKICFAFFDGDFYGSIMDSFKKVYDKMVPGGIILVHDYEWMNFPGVKKACDEFLKDKPEKVVKGMNGIGIMRKQ
ncbi:MAG TPA: TylF/MycF/NovP-related O-methyltransferase [Spirochaetota bacterium]|nr:TylF/MycF/NovP-related O-methyltransferase [Spirochaetota bacterium]